MKKRPTKTVNDKEYRTLIQDPLNPHARLRGVSSLGAFDPEGTFHTPPLDLAPPTRGAFRERTLKIMLKREAITAERVELLQSWKHSGFDLNTTRRVAAGDRQSLETFLQYIERPPVSLRGLTYRPYGMVHYQGNWFHPGLGRDHQLVTPVDFLASSCLTSLSDTR